jgi:hypothetical protein
MTTINTRQTTGITEMNRTEKAHPYSYKIPYSQQTISLNLVGKAWRDTSHISHIFTSALQFYKNKSFRNSAGDRAIGV